MTEYKPFKSSKFSNNNNNNNSNNNKIQKAYLPLILKNSNQFRFLTKCKRCIYTEYTFNIDLNKSKQEQKLYINKIPICERCGFRNIQKQTQLIYDFDNPNVSKYKDIITKIKHKHNSNKTIIHNILNPNTLQCQHYIDKYCDICDKYIYRKESKIYNLFNQCQHIKYKIENIQY